MNISLRTIVKEFESFGSENRAGNIFRAVDDVSFEVPEGRLVTLLGPSGCGKTTLLRMVAGFEDPTRGDIYYGQTRMNDVPPNKRDAAMVFQSYALFPHLTIRENIGFGLKLRRPVPADIEARIDRAFELVELSGLGNRRPDQLSGGQQQRVALARAIIMEPQVLLFDEPLSNLDAKLREQMRIDIRTLQQRLGITSLYVTHDQVEAMSISDSVIVMNQGRLEQMGPPRELYERPVNRFVAAFVGKANFLQNPRGEGRVMVRPEAVRLAPAGGSGDFEAAVTRATYLGGATEYEIAFGDERAVVHERNLSGHAPFAVGDTVSVTLEGELVRMD